MIITIYTSCTSNATGSKPGRYTIKQAWSTSSLLGILSGKPWLLVQCWNFKLLLPFHGEIYQKACFWEIDLRPAVSSDTILILHIDLGTKNQSHQRIINKYSWNGVNRNWNWFPLCIFNKKWMVTIPMSSNSLSPWRIWIPKETIQIQWVSLA